MLCVIVLPAVICLGSGSVPSSRRILLSLCCHYLSICCGYVLVCFSSMDHAESLQLQKGPTVDLDNFYSAFHYHFSLLAQFMEKMCSSFPLACISKWCRYLYLAHQHLIPVSGVTLFMSLFFLLCFPSEALVPEGHVTLPRRSLLLRILFTDTW